MSRIALRRSLSVALAAAAWFVAPAGASAHDCAKGTAAEGVVAAVLDGLTVRLADGRLVRLEGIDIPATIGAATGETPAARARNFLETEVVGRPVEVWTQSAAIDRYERTRAQLFVKRKPLEATVQQSMVERGFARVAGRVGDRACATALLRREQAARTARLGLWGDPAYRVHSADDVAALLQLRGKLALVEGRVLSVRESGGTIYVNFGRRWSEDFTATIAKRSERTFSEAGLDPKRLERRVVRIRGWVEERGGPWIDVTRPEQIEVVRN